MPVVVRDSGVHDDEFNVAEIVCYSPDGEMVYKQELSLRALLVLVQSASKILFSKIGGYI